MKNSQEPEREWDHIDQSHLWPADLGGTAQESALTKSLVFFFFYSDACQYSRILYQTTGIYGPGNLGKFDFAS